LRRPTGRDLIIGQNGDTVAGSNNEWIRFVTGLVIYFLYSRRHSRLATKWNAGS
jgi:hypothetical protein